MQLLKENRIIKEYILPVIFLPIGCLILVPIVNFIFKLGAYQGTFLRALFELVLKNF